MSVIVLRQRMRCFVSGVEDWTSRWSSEAGSAAYRVAASVEIALAGARVNASRLHVKTHDSGLMSRKANVLSLSNSFIEGMSPAVLVRSMSSGLVRETCP